MDDGACAVMTAECNELFRSVSQENLGISVTGTATTTGREKIESERIFSYAPCDGESRSFNASCLHHVLNLNMCIPHNDV